MFHIEPSHLLCSAKQMTGFHKKCNIGLNCSGLFPSQNQVFSSFIAQLLIGHFDRSFKPFYNSYGIMLNNIESLYWVWLMLSTLTISSFLLPVRKASGLHFDVNVNTSIRFRLCFIILNWLYLSNDGSKQSWAVSKVS